jgi:predicted transcriptional regulator
MPGAPDADNDRQAITEAELTIMQVIWQAGNLLTVNDVYNRLKHAESWKYNTVATFMIRLTEKGYLDYSHLDGRGRTRLFRPLISEKQYQKDQLRRFISRQFRGSAKDLIAAFMSGEPADQDEIDALRQWLDEQ